MTDEAPKSKSQLLTEAEAADREAKNMAKAAADYAEANPAPAAPYDDLSARAKLHQDAADADRPVPPTDEEVEAAQAAAAAAAEAAKAASEAPPPEPPVA